MSQTLTINTHKISRVSRCFRLLFQALMILLPLLAIMGWIKAPEAISTLGEGAGFVIRAIPIGIPVLHPLSLSTKLLGFAVSLIPLSFQLAGLYFLVKLFGLYEKSEIFSLHSVNYIKKIGYTLLFSQIAHCIFYQGLLSLVITWGNPHGHRYAAITFSEINLGLLLTSLLIILISWIMVEGCKLKQEQELTI